MKKNNRIKYSFDFILLCLSIVAVLSVGTNAKDKNGSDKTTAKIYSPSSINESGFNGDSYRLNINNINLPMSRAGVMADVNIPPDGTLGRFDGFGFLYSGGFFLSGYSGSRLWANAVASASLVEDYVPGTVAKGSSDPNAGIYVVKRTDGLGSQAYQDWKKAVDLGADFYDANKDGVYDPYVDTPDLLGDETVWCVYNDGTPAAQRRWNTISPIGLEVRQTVFALSSKGQIGNIIFLRYRIKYVGLGKENEPNQLDSVYFGAWADPDIGANPDNDLVGSDISRNAIFTYKDGSDESYGVNPPSFFITFFSGPVEYIPGTTFVDNDGNGEYDPEIDEPLDTAYSVRGQILGKEIYPGARNQPLSSVVEYLNGFSTRFEDPNTHQEARNYMLGLEKDGSQVDPCTLPIGEVNGDCNAVDPRFWFSGDPVTGTGWIGVQPWDVRMMSNTGPFTLYKDTPENREAGRLVEKEIVVAYVVGRGTDNINSITVAREINDVSQKIFDNNFPSPPPPPLITYEVNTGDDFIDLTWNTAPNVKYVGLDTVLNYDRRVQGFYVNAFRTNSNVESIDGITNSKELVNYSIDNGIDNIYYNAPNGGIDLRRAVASPEYILDSATYADPDQGRIRLTITEDPFTGGALVKGKEYYFAITQYTLNHTSIVNKDDGVYGPPGDYIEVGTAYEEYDQLQPLQDKYANQTRIIKVVFGEDTYSPAIAPGNGTIVSGTSDGEVKYVVVDKEQLTGDEYAVQFHKIEDVPVGESYQTYWSLSNTTTGDVLIDSSGTFDFDTTNYSGKMTEGFITKVKPVTPTIGLSNVSYTPSEDRWYTDFRTDSATGVFYVGQDISQGVATTVASNTSARSSAISADELTTVEIRFGQTGKAYRYLAGFVGTPITRRQIFVYAAAVTASDTGGTKGSVGLLGEGFVEVPFTAWAIEKDGSERQLTVGFIEFSADFKGNADGNWDPGTIASGLGNEVIAIFPDDYDPTGSQIQYTGNSNGWADIMRGYNLNDPSATQDQVSIASSEWFDAMYVVSLKKMSESSFYKSGDKLTIPMEVYPYTDSDKYTFKTISSGALSQSEKKATFDKVNVFPNPLYGFNPATSYDNSPADEPFVTFSNLPEKVTIKIFTLSGTLIKTLETADKSNPTSPFLRWGLLNEKGLRVASGLYLAIVSSPDYGQKILKFSIILPQKQLQRY